MTVARRALGVALLLGVYAPLHRLLTADRAGPAGVATRAAAESAWTLGLYGTGIVVVLALALARLVPGSRLVDAARRLGGLLERPPNGLFALATGALATVGAALTAYAAHGASPTSVDEMVQLLHARAIAEGRATVPTLGVDAAFVVQNGVVTPEGWASIYPPLHTALLAVGLALGTAWLVGPVALGVATAACTDAFEALLGPRRGRATGLLLAVTPFWLLLGATHLSHATAAAAIALVLWAGVRARGGSFIWAVASGAAVGAAVTARPWIGLVSGVALLAALWVPPRSRGAGGAAADAEERMPLAVQTSRLAGVVVGGLPFALLLFWWNATLFGAPFRLGYSVAFGPAHGLGFHVDPWGNVYGLREALAYTGADLVQLGIDLLQTPLPAVTFVGGALLLARRRTVPPVLTAWIVAALAANALYWHHGIHFGPRMLFESTPAWIALFVLSARSVARWPGVRGAGAWCVTLSLIGAALLAPGVFRAAHAGSLSGRATAPSADDEASAVVFVHGSWASRIAATLASDGMRRDSIETLLRRNDICVADRYARARLHTPETAVNVDLVPRPGSPPDLATRRLSDGNFVRVDDAERWDATCRREAEADRFGVAELEPLAWQAPPLATFATTVVRDLGPARNARLRGVLPGRWLVYVAGEDRGGPRLLDYDAGMELLWRGAAGR